MLNTPLQIAAFVLEDDEFITELIVFKYVVGNATFRLIQVNERINNKYL